MSEHDQQNETIAWKTSGDWRDDPRVTAYALGELEALDAESRAAIAAAIARDPELCKYVEDLRASGESLGAELAAMESTSAMVAAGSPGVKGGRLARAEEFMAAAFSSRAASDTQNVSAPEEKPPAAAGSGRRAREVKPSPFRRYFAVGSAAAMLAAAVLAGVMVASYGEMSPSTPVAVDMPTPAQFQKIAESVEKMPPVPYPENGKLQQDAALKLHTREFKAYAPSENPPATPEAVVASVSDLASAPPGTGGASTSSGSTSSGMGFFQAGPSPAPPPGPVLQRRNQRISKLLEEVDRVTDENLALRGVDTTLAWAPEKYKQTTDLDPYYLDSKEVDLPINGPARSAAMTRDSRYDLFFSGPLYPPPFPGITNGPDQLSDAGILYRDYGDIRDRVAIGEEAPSTGLTSAWVEEELTLDPSQRAQRERLSILHGDYLIYPKNWEEIAKRTSDPSKPLSDSAVTADAKPVDEIAEAIMVAEASQPEAKRAEEITKLHRVLIKSQQGVALDAQDQVLEKELDDLRMRLKERQKENQARGISEDSIATANVVIADKYGPNVISEKKPEAEVAGAKKETNAKQPPLSGMNLTEQQRLQRDINELKARLAQAEEKSGLADSSIGNAELMVDNKYGPNAGVKTKESGRIIGGLEQVYFESLGKEQAATGPSYANGKWVNGTAGDANGSGIDNDGFRIRRGELKFDLQTRERVADALPQPMEWAARYDGMSNLFNRSRVAQGQADVKSQVIAGGIDYFIKGHNAKLQLAYTESPKNGVRPMLTRELALLPGDRIDGDKIEAALNACHGVVPHHDFTVSGWYAATGYRLNDNLWANAGVRRGNALSTEGPVPIRRAPSSAPEVPGGMVVWHFDAKDPARGRANDTWRLARVGGRFGDLMSSLDDYHIGGAVKDGGLALVGVDGEFDHGRMGYVAPHPDEGRQTESYAAVNENPFEKARTISTFSVDVDTASYSNVRRFLNGGSLPPPGAVRCEELINYFRYAYEPPPGDAKEPFATHVEVATCPWNAAHRLVRIALKGREIDPNKRPSSNLVFLVDVSGSMGDANKLDLVRQGLNLLVENLGARDRVAIVTYSDKIKVELESTPCDQKRRILERINGLHAGGSTNGGEGIQKAYAIAAKNRIAGGTNRVILCTDGDFNVGTTSNDELAKLIEQKAKSGVFLSVLGFGMGNLKDDKLEAIADKGNGHYAYIDSFQEAKKVFGQELAGTLVTIAKDVKVQVEFNPAAAHSYRLIGYENRLMRKEDFADDTKDAGEIGAGHAVTALYEVIPAGAEEAVQPVRVPLDVLLLNASPEEVAKLTFVWKQTAGPKADLRDADRPRAYFLPTADGEYEFEVSAIADASVIKTTVKRTVKLADLAAPKTPAERPSRYLEEAQVKEDAKASGELLTVWLRYKQPEEDKSTELSVPVRDAGHKLEQSSGDFRFASSVAAFGMLLRGSLYAKDLNWDFVLELAGESKGADPEGQRAEFIDLAKKAKALSGK